MTWFRLDMIALEIVPVTVADVGKKFVNLGGAGVHPKAADDFSYYPTHADAVQVATKLARKRLAAARAALRDSLDTYHRVKDLKT